MNSLKTILLISSIVLLFSLFYSCSGSGAGEPGETTDCTSDYQNIKIRVPLNGTIEFKDIQNSQTIFQVSRIEKQSTRTDSIKIRAYGHFITENGQFITGLTQNKKKKLICKITDSIKTRSINISKYNIYESKELKRKNLAIAFVLDHSGSMGELRTITLQNSIIDFLTTYNQSQDKILIYKFDNRVSSVQIPATINDDFKQNFAIGLSGFGSTTALFDGIGNAIQALSNFNDYTKIIVPLTDGYENSSIDFLNPDTLIQLANKNDIIISPIGFGENIDKKLLADKFAAKTGGSYHQICKTEDFKIIFKDIYMRFTNYYLVEFNILKAYGVHNFYFTACIEQKGKEDLQLRATNSVYIEPPRVGESIVIQNIYFDFDSYKIKEDLSKDALENIYYYLMENPEVTVEIQGHTDAKGDDAYNDKLSQNRADAVRDYLIKKGITKSKLTTKGFGKRLPLTENETDEGRALNRRVEFLIKNTDIKTTDYRYYKTPEESVIDYK